MSKVTMLATPRSRASAAPAMTPPAGPESSIWAGLSRAARGVAAPPSLRISRKGASTPISVRRCSTIRT